MPFLQVSVYWHCSTLDSIHNSTPTIRILFDTWRATNVVYLLTYLQFHINVWIFCLKFISYSGSAENSKPEVWEIRKWPTKLYEKMGEMKITDQCLLLLLTQTHRTTSPRLQFLNTVSHSLVRALRYSADLLTLLPLHLLYCIWRCYGCHWLVVKWN